VPIQTVPPAEPLASFLPVKPIDYEILFVLFRRELHGYAMVKAISDRTDGRVRLEPSNLYRRIRRLMQDGLVEESEERPAPELDDERRRYYSLTRLGRSVLAAEARRMRALVLEAEDSLLIPAS
jgi:DNA-binding PadR family transcriptional regulator